MPDRRTQELLRDRAYRVTAHPLIVRPAQLERRIAGEAGADQAPAALGQIRWRFYDGGAEVREVPRVPGGGATGDLANSFAALRLETGPFPSPLEVRDVADRLLAQAEFVSPPLTYLHSGRPLYGQVIPLGATEEVSGYNLSVTMRRRVPTGEPTPLASVTTDAYRTYGVQHNAAWVHPMISPAARLAAWDELESRFTGSSHAEWQAERDRIEAVAREQFDFDTIPRAQVDLTMRCPGLAGGLWAPSFGGGQLYHPWDTLDREQYHTTLGDSLFSPVAMPWCSVGEGASTEVRAILEPLRFQIVFSWTTVYDVGIIFSGSFQIVEFNTGRYQDRLPLTFRFADTTDPLINDAAMGPWIQGSNRFAVAYDQDLANQIISIFIVKVVSHREDGLYSIYSGNMRRGDLAAVLDVKRGARVDRYRVFRKTDRQGGDLVTWGALTAQGVTGHIPNEDSRWPGGHPWQPV